MQGGCGGRPTKDGIDGVNFSAGSLRNVPTESIELEAPVLVNRYMLTDEVAAGRYRGGSGVTIEFQSLAPNAIVTARGMDRFKLRPYGRKGGHPGDLGETLINPGTPRERNIGKVDILQLNPGDVVRITAPSGAGYGDPLDRDPEMVLTDLENGFVSAEEAANVYGIVAVDGAIDVAATSARARIAQQPALTEEFVFGRSVRRTRPACPARSGFGGRTPYVVYPAATRQFLRDRLYARIEATRTPQPPVGRTPPRAASRARGNDGAGAKRDRCRIGKQCIAD